MSNVLQAIANHEPAHLALAGDALEYTYGDLKKEIAMRAEKLSGVSVLGLDLDNGPEWVLWDLACVQAVVPCVPLPPFFTEAQKTHALRLAGVSHLLSPAGLAETGLSFCHGALPEGTAKITFTSGTTGTPKGVCLPQGAMEQVAGSIVEVLGEKFAGIHQCVLPLAVLLENVAGVYAGLIAGCTISLTSLEKFRKNYENLHAALKSTKTTSIILVPEILRMLMGQVVVKGPLPDLKFVAVGGSKTDPAFIVQARKIGLPVYEGYGLSECASVVSLNTPQHDGPGTVGQILPHADVFISKDEIQIRNPGFLGYIGEASSGIFGTGDLGSIDDSGFLSITGRKKNVLITSYGRNVSPEWVESLLLAQPEIAQAIVYGDAQPHLSALIAPSSSQADIKAAVKAANQSLPDYAQVKEFQIVPPFTVADNTLTGTGRPRRKEILNRYMKENKNEFLQQAG